MGYRSVDQSPRENEIDRQWKRELIGFATGYFPLKFLLLLDILFNNTKNIVANLAGHFHPIQNINVVYCIECLESMTGKKANRKSKEKNNFENKAKNITFAVKN